MPQIITQDSPIPTELPKPSFCSHKKCILISIFLLVVGVAGGFYLGGIKGSLIFGQSTGKTEIQKGSYDDGYQAALDFARKKVQEKGMFFPGGQILGIPSATVKSVSGDSIVIELDASILDFFAEGKITKTITVSDTATIQQNIPKLIEDYQKEEAAFRKEMEELNAKSKAGEIVDYGNISPPVPYNIKKLEVKDIKAGDIISVISTTDASKSDTIEATNIMVAYIPEELTNPNENMGNVSPGGTPPTPTPDLVTETTMPTPEDPAADVIGTPAEAPADAETTTTPVEPDAGEAPPAETPPSAPDAGETPPAETPPPVPDATGDGTANGSETAPQ